MRDRVSAAERHLLYPWTKPLHFWYSPVMGVVFGGDVVSLSFPGSSREVLEYSGLPTDANRLRAGLPTLGHLRLRQRPPSSFLLSDRAGF